MKMATGNKSYFNLRIKNLEKKKVISGYTAIVDEELFNSNTFTPPQFL